ncbi:MAG: hypothetical protein RL660_3145 [Bacteroidota bacterium]|jgi:hypothetical protein
MPLFLQNNNSSIAVYSGFTRILELQAESFVAFEQLWQSDTKAKKLMFSHAGIRRITIDYANNDLQVQHRSNNNILPLVTNVDIGSTDNAEQLKDHFISTYYFTVKKQRLVSLGIFIQFAMPIICWILFVLNKLPEFDTNKNAQTMVIIASAIFVVIVGFAAVHTMRQRKKYLANSVVLIPPKQSNISI